MMQSPASQPLSLRQYSKDVPPGWRPRAYPIREYKEALGVWSKLTRLDEDQIGPAIMSRLEGGALRVAHALTIQRIDPGTLGPRNFQGIDAVSLPASDAVINPTTGDEIIPAYLAGARVLVNRLLELFFLDDQDLAWTSLDKFFTFQRPSDMDFSTYVIEWDRLLAEAEQHGGLHLGDTGKCWIFWSRSNLPERVLSDLRLKVNGDLSRYRDMIRLQLKISKNEQASMDQHGGYKNYHGDSYNDYDMTYTDGDSWWYDDADSSYYEDWSYDDWYDDYYEHDDSLYQWYDDYDYDHNYDNGSTHHQDSNHDHNNDTSTYDDYYGKGKKGGKGKHKGKQPSSSQCTSCGSKWHNTDNCPMKDNNGSNHKQPDTHHADHSTDSNTHQ